MKRTNILWFLLCALILSGCAKDNLVLDGPEPTPQMGIGTEDIRESDLQAQAKTYYELLNTSIRATDAHTDTNPETENPLAAKLQSLELVDEQDQPVSFYDLDETQQQDFLKDWGYIESAALSDKIRNVEGLADDLEQYNDAVQYALNSEAVTRNGELKVTDKKAFFQRIEERYNENLATRMAEEATRVSNGGGEIAVPVTKVKQMLQTYARRGDYLVRLPKHGCTYSYLDYTGKELSVGHASVITQTVRTTDAATKELAIGAQGKGVVTENINYWTCKSYIMGVQRVTWRIKWNWFRSTTYKEVTRVSNPGALADYALRYKGRKYVNWYEFAVAKWVAPTRFICTTLVWYSAKQAYGIDVSDWYSPIVTPSGLVTNENTYVRAVIQ